MNQIEFMDCILAAGQGNMVAQHNLGVTYVKGDSVCQDFEQAFFWYKKAAEQGFAPSQYTLAVMYVQGEGVCQNYNEAEKWFRISANAGVVDAQFSLGLIYANGHGVNIDYKEAAEWFEVAAEQGHTNAIARIATAYLEGEGVDIDKKKAYQWFQKAAVQENQYAINMLEQLKKEIFIEDGSSSISNLSNFTFKSSHHYRFENEIEVSGGLASRVIRIEDSISGNEGYSVTIYDTENEPLWKNNVSMSTKPMKIISRTENIIELRGWGEYIIPLVGKSIPYSNYGLTIHYIDNCIEKIILHMFDRNIDIKYLA